MTTRLAVVYNPVKVADLAALREAVQQHCPGDWDWLETTEDDPGAGQAKAALESGADLVLVCGGDGTVAACAGALAGGSATMAVVPAGTGNLLARNLDLPLDVDDALEVAFGSSERTIDVLESGDRRFVVMAGLGFDAALIRDTDDDLKDKLGWLAYLGGLRRAFTRSPRASFTITVDENTPIQRRAVGVLVGNVGQLQAGIRLLPDAEPDDSHLDVIVLAPHTVADWPVLVGRILRRRAGEGEQADVLRGRRVQISAEQSLPVEYDGELCGEADSLDVEVLPAALTVRCPRP